MEERLIGANRLKEVLERNFGHTGGASVLAQLIDNAPTIDLVQHGHWIYHENEVINAKCSVCNRYADRYATPKYSFCPYCGADMRGAK